MDKLSNLHNVSDMYAHSVAIFRTAAASLIDCAGDYKKEYKLDKDEVETAKSFGSGFSVPIMVKGAPVQFAITKVKFINDYPYLWGFNEETGEEISKLEMPSYDTEVTIAVANFLSHIIADIL